MKKIALLSCFAALVSTGCFGSALNMQPAAGCSTQALPAELRNRNKGAGVISKRWLDEKTLAVRTYLFALCDGSTISGDYALGPDKITITYSESLGSNPTKCRCARQYEHVFKDLRKKDYAITVIEED